MIEQPASQDIWVNVTEGAAVTNYNRNYVVKLAKRMWDMPEDQRAIKIRKRSNGYELWLPDLIAYTQKIGHGPQRKRKLTS